MPEKNLFRKPSLIALATAATLVLASCSPLPAAAPVSEVNYRACLVTETASDQIGINELADYSVKQAVATYGVKRTVLASSATKFVANVKKLVKQGCSMIVVTGDAFSQTLATVVKAHPEVNFLYLAEKAQTALLTEDLGNLAIHQIDMFEAGLLLGHLAASMSELHTVAVLCEQPKDSQMISGIRSGVNRYIADTGVSTQFYVGPEFGPGTSMRIALGCKGEFDMNGIGYAVATRIVGFGRDLYSNPKLAEQKRFIAATVVPDVRARILEVIASDLEGDFIGGSLGSTVATFGNGGLVVTPEHEVPYPLDEIKFLEQLALDYETTLK